MLRLNKGILFCRRLFLAALATAVVSGCSTPEKTTRTTTHTVSTADTLAMDSAVLLDDSSAIAAIRRLEADPLDSAAADLRRYLFLWLVASPKLQNFVSDTPPVDELQKSDFPYREELLLQYLFGSAAWVISGASGDLTDQREAGIRSLIAAYRSMIQREPARRDAFVDMLDDLRRRGELRGYVLRFKNR